MLWRRVTMHITICRELCVLVVWIACVFGQAVPVVDTSVGRIVGVKDEFTKFLGVPYAVVNETDRFGPARPALQFDTPFFANKNPPICPQIWNGIIQGHIQCLNLNIYKPNNVYHNILLPVMVYIHGGGFMFGDGNLNSFSPVFLVKQDIIVVTVNYRLGPYGFLCLEQDEYTNQGLKDQSLALKWVKHNIKYFGGDDNNILLFGHSAGSISIDFHLLSKEDKLFNKVILQSGQAITPLIIEKHKNHEYLINLAAKLGLDTKHIKTSEVFKRISSIDSKLLINATRNENFRPCVHDFVIGDASKDLKGMKIMIGNAEKEMIFFYKDLANYTNLVEQELSKEFVNVSGTDISRVEQLYLTGNVKDNIIDFGCDFYFNYPIEKSIRHYLRKRATVYRYIFSYDGKRNYIKVREGIHAEGATHGDELGYLFDTDVFGNTTLEADQRVINTMTSFWTNFAKYGDPTPHNLTTLHWPQIGDHLKYYMNLGAFPLVQEDYRKDKMFFWDSFYKDFRKYSKGIHYPEESESRKNTASRLLITISLVINLIICLIVIY